MKAFRLSVAVCSALLIAGQFVPLSANATTPVRMEPTENRPLDPPDDDPCSLIFPFFDAMNAGDFSKAAHMFAPHPMIMDPFQPPFVWHSFIRWHAASVEIQKSRHLSDFQMRALSPLSVSPSYYGSAYCDPPVIMSFKFNGEPATWKGIVTFTTVHTAQGWRISGFAMATNSMESFWKTFLAEPTPPQ